LSNTAYIIPEADRWLLGVANAPLTWWYAWRSAVHGKDEALRFIREYVERLPVVHAPDPVRAQGTHIVDQLVELRKQIARTCIILNNWYSAELDVTKPTRTMLEPFRLSVDEFMREIRKARGVRRPLSAAGVQAVREEYAQTVQPMRAGLREAERLEWRLSDLVNEAYGLTPDEVRLMWATAPPRMPLMPESDTVEQGEDEAAE
jgi:hypothetical protein